MTSGPIHLGCCCGQAEVAQLLRETKTQQASTLAEKESAEQRLKSIGEAWDTDRQALEEENAGGYARKVAQSASSKAWEQTVAARGEAKRWEETKRALERRVSEMEHEGGGQATNSPSPGGKKGYGSSGHPRLEPRSMSAAESGAGALVLFDEKQATSNRVWEDIERRAIEGAATAKEQVQRMARSDSIRSGGGGGGMSSALVPVMASDGGGGEEEERAMQAEERAMQAVAAERELARLANITDEAQRHISRMGP